MKVPAQSSDETSAYRSIIIAVYSKKGDSDAYAWNFSEAEESLQHNWSDQHDVSSGGCALASTSSYGDASRSLSSIHSPTPPGPNSFGWRPSNDRPFRFVWKRGSSLTTG